MKKILLGLLVLIIGNSAFSQNCQYSKNEVDKFTKSTIKTTKDLLIAGGSFKLDGTLYASLSKINDSRFLNIKIIAWDDFVIETNGEMMFLFDDESVINLSFIKFAVGHYENNSGSKSWTANASLRIVDENYDILKTKNAKEIRIYLKEGYLDLPVPEKKKYWNEFKESLKCIE
tara:strand:- start:925 stop:1446 length:522 start_codon:yes stop_codon:yes gene_type:complete